MADWRGKRSLQRATVWPSASKRRSNSAHAEAEDRKLRKELAFGGPCFEGTLQKPTLVSESSPVAGTIGRDSIPLIILRCRGDTRDSKYNRLPHICSR